MATPTETTKDPVPQKKRGAGAPSGQAWQSAAAVQDLRNAFILGWSLVELRSRVQMAALDDKKLPSTAKGSDGKGGPDPDNPVQLVKGMNNRLLRASRMRTAFNSIVALQRAKFPTSVTLDTLYDPPDKEDLPYLYPPSPDYANIGINPLGIEEDGRPVWADFRLFDATRRAINCLTLLLVTPEDSLVPTMVASQQARLSDQILGAAEKESRRAGRNPDDAAAMTHSLATTAVRSWEHYDAEASAVSAQENIPLAPRTEHGRSITTLSFLTVRLLQAWDGYLRERITAEGFGANNLITLLAYEAGRNMATISWNTSVNAILLENQAAEDEEARKNLREKLYEVWKDSFTDSNLVQVLHQITALSTVLDDAYYDSLGKPDALTTENPVDDLLVKPDPARPSQVLQAVRQSIEYWQRTILWLGMQGGAEGETSQAANLDLLDLKDFQHLRNALIEQSGIWFNLMTGQQDLRGFTVESITHQVLDSALDDFRALAQRDLPAAAQQIAKEVGDVIETATNSVLEISNTATQAAKKGLKQLLDNVSPILWIVIGVSLLSFLVLVGYIVITGRTEAVAMMFTSLATTVLSFFGMKRGNDAKSKSEQEITEEIDKEKTDKTQAIQQKKEGLQSNMAAGTSGLTGIVSGTLGQAGNFLVSAYEKGLQRIQIELQSLNYSVAVTHPLIEYFILHYRHQGIQEDFDFLTKVIWSSANREEQLRRVVTAAFGPVSILLTSPGKARPEAETPAPEPALGD